MKPSTKRTLFYVIFIAMVIAPAVVVALNWRSRNIWINISVLLGFLGMALAGTQLIPVGKIRWLSDALNMDAVYRNHHKLSLVSIGLVLAHPLMLYITNAMTRSEESLAVQLGEIGLFGLVFIGLTSVARKKLKLGYTTWLILHDLATAIILVFGLWHLFAINYYMNIPAVRTVWYVLIAIWVLLIVYIRLLHPLSVARKPFVVESGIAESKDTYSLNLKPQGHKGFKFEAGQIAWISLNKNPFIISRNPFSFSGSALAPEGKLRFSIKAVGDFTARIAELKPGDRVYVDGPYGAFNTNDKRTQKGLVLLAGGIGLAPMMSILGTLADRNDKRPVYLFYGDLNEETALYQEEFAALQGRMNLKLIQVLEKPHNPDYPFKGYITKDLMASQLPADYKDLFYFICGPAPMLNAMDRNLAALEVPPSQIHVERYEMA